VRDGSLTPGARLPAIQTLATEFGTTAITVRRALRDLEEEGLIRVEHGVGSFVTEWRGDDWLALASFAEEAAEQRLVVRTRILQRQPAMASPAASAALRLPEGECPAHLQRLRLMGERPVVLQSSYLSPELAPILEPLEDGDSLYRAIHARTGRAAIRAREEIRAIAVAPEEAGLLECRVGTPGWRARRVTQDAAGRPLLYDVATIPGDRMGWVVERRARGAELRMVYRGEENDG